MIALNEQLLEDKLAALETARSWAPRVVSRLEAMIRTGEDEALFRINPVKFAHEYNIAEEEALDLFLHATASGLFTTDWMILCPMCSAIIESFGTLHAVNTGHYHCQFCQHDYKATLDDYIVVSFTIAPAVRAIVFHKPETLTPFQYMANVAFSGSHLQCEVPKGVTCLSPQQIFEHCLKGCQFLAPGEVAKFAFVAGESIAPGESTINGTEVTSGAHFFVAVKGKRLDQPQHRAVEFTGRAWEPAQSEFAPGPVVVELTNTSDKRVFVTMVDFPDASPHCCSKLDFEPYLSAKRLLTTQTFRDLFRSDLIKETEGIGVRDITLIFTDLKGSTELYERIGDLNAFAVVQEHFERLTDATVRHRGAIIKTLGDAVMAAFATPVDAVNAALAMQAETARFNHGRAEHDLVLKVGLHRGAAIAVTLNERLDYFGQSVNVAARVESLADGGEICMTREVYEAPGVLAALGSYSTSVAATRMKGVQQTMPIWRVRCAPQLPDSLVA